MSISPASAPDLPGEEPLAPAKFSDQNKIWKWIVVVVAILYVLGSIYFLVDMRGRLERLERGQESSRSSLYDLNKRLTNTQANTETLASQLGMTKKELAQKASELV